MEAMQSLLLSYYKMRVHLCKMPIKLRVRMLPCWIQSLKVYQAFLRKAHHRMNSRRRDKIMTRLATLSRSTYVEMITLSPVPRTL